MLRSSWGGSEERIGVVEDRGRKRGEPGGGAHLNEIHPRAHRGLKPLWAAYEVGVISPTNATEPRNVLGRPRRLTTWTLDWAC